MNSEHKSSSTETTTSPKVSSPKQTSVETRATAKANAQELSDLETERGLRGTEVDNTPNENYTVAGVTSGKPTPESDMKFRANIQKDLKARPAKLVGRHHKNMEAEADKGYRGAATDDTPNENYSVKGVTSGKPTPETI